MYKLCIKFIDIRFFKIISPNCFEHCIRKDLEIKKRLNKRAKTISKACFITSLKDINNLLSIKQCLKLQYNYII